MKPSCNNTIRIQTPLCDLLGIRYPIVQAPIGSASCPELAAAVSNAGGLGMLALSWREPTEITQLLQKTRKLTDKPFGVNFVMDAPILEDKPLEPRLRICLEAKIPLVSLAWGNLTPQLVADIHRAGARVAYTVWNVEQAIQAVEIGVDILVAQGIEAGGHLSSQINTVELLASVFKALPHIPVVAAGGIGNGADMVQVLGMGASGVWMGTRFVASRESLAHASYKQRLVECAAEDTVLNTLYSIGWPNAPHRTIRNSTAKSWQERGYPALEDCSDKDEIVAYFPDGTAVFRYEDVVPLKGMTGNLEPLAHYAGTSVDRVHSVLAASEIIEMLLSESRQALFSQSD